MDISQEWTTPGRTIAKEGGRTLSVRSGTTTIGRLDACTACHRTRNGPLPLARTRQFGSHPAAASPRAQGIVRERVSPPRGSYTETSCARTVPGRPGVHDLAPLIPTTAATSYNRGVTEGQRGAPGQPDDERRYALVNLLIGWLNVGAAWLGVAVRAFIGLFAILGFIALLYQIQLAKDSAAKSDERAKQSREQDKRDTEALLARADRSASAAEGTAKAAADSA